jgi:ubiquinone/menaquinone biosynthesis C-methylase UbiE
VSFLTNAGFEAKGVDSLESFLEAGRQRFPGVDLRTNSRYAFPFLEKSFDTVIMKEVIHHVADESDEDRFLAEVRRVCKRRLIVFDPNPTLILQATRRMLRHVDPICAPETAKTILARAGFETKSLEFTELLAFPLSGGYISPVLLPNLELVRASVLRLDRLLMKLARWTRLDSRLCWRYLLVADLAG